MTISIGLSPAKVVVDAGGATFNVTLTGTSTAGSTVFVGASFTPLTTSTAAELTIASTGLTPIKDKSTNQASTGGNAQQLILWRFDSVASATDRVFTITFPTTGLYAVGKVFEVIGLDASPLENTNSGGALTATNPAIATGAASNTTTDGIAISMGCIDSGSNPCLTQEPPTGYTSLAYEADTTAHQSLQMAYKLLNSAGANSTSATSNSSGGSGCWAAQIAVYKGVPPGPTVMSFNPSLYAKRKSYRPKPYAPGSRR